MLAAGGRVTAFVIDLGENLAGRLTHRCTKSPSRKMPVYWLLRRPLPRAALVGVQRVTGYDLFSSTQSTHTLVQRLINENFECSYVYLI